MFKIGDIVIATCKRGYPYSITCDGWVGRVVAITSSDTIDVVCADFERDDYNDYDVFTVSSEHFELLSGAIHNSELLDTMFNELM